MCVCLCASYSFVLGVEGAANDEAAHFAGAGANLVQLGIAQVAASGVVCAGAGLCC